MRGCVMRRSSAALLVLAAFTMAACADFYTVSRRTTLPREPAKSGLAIHMDAQQRLFIYGADGKYCAEASPDAMAAYAAALALGVSAPGYGAGSGANSSQSQAASIGLRTQSITLMRDALYRLCEATANGTVSKLSATQLLARSQDLTAVVVAVEQLTGAVAANQAILTSNTNADASASLIADAKQLDNARKNEAARIEERNKAQQERDAQREVVNAQKTRTETAERAAVDASDDNPPPANLAELQDNARAERQKLDQEQSNLDSANARLAAAEESVSDATQVREAVASNNSQALTSASTGTGGAGQFSAVVPRNQLSKDATAQVAMAVDSMVTEVLRKDYTVDACMTLMTNPDAFSDLKPAQEQVLNLTLKQCAALMEAKIQNEVYALKPVAFGETASTARLEAALQTPGFQQKLQQWLAENAPGSSITTFVYGGEFAVLREQAIRDLGVQ